jgi:mannose-6-phosphate isomerase-like protein (cupin superfamily)
MKLIRATDRPFEPASHEDPQRPGVYKRVILRREELLDGRVQMINWARLPPGRSFRAHYHEDMEETFVIISGTCRMEVDGQSFALGPGDTLVVSPGEVHAMHHGGDEPVEYLVVGISLGRNGRTVVVDETA